MAFPVEEVRIEEAERLLGRRFPPALRERLLRNNGGEIEAVDDNWILHPVWDPSDRKRKGRTANHIVRETSVARTRPDFPEGAIAVAGNGTGNLMIVRSGSDDIELWDHETGETEPVEVDWT